MTGATQTVSVIVPVYNGAHHLQEVLRTVLDQTRLPHEVIFVNDGSTDDSGRMLDELAAGTDAVPVRILHQLNRGQSAGRNAAAAVAEGSLLAFLDQDDRWHPEHLALLTAPFAASPRLGFAYSDFDEIDGAGRLIVRGFIAAHGLVHPKSSVIAWIGEDAMVLPTAAVVSAAAFRDVGGFDPQLQGYEDDDLWIRLFRAGWEVHFEPRSLASFRVHQGSSSTDASFRESRSRFFRKLAAEIPDDQRTRRLYVTDVLVPRMLRSSIADYFVALRAGDDDEARAIAGFIDEVFESSSSALLRPHERLVLRHPRLARLGLRLYRTVFRRGRIDPYRRLSSAHIVIGR